MRSWSFLTNHARALLFIAEQPDARLIDVAGAIGVTERTAYVIVDDLTEAGYVVKERVGRRNRYSVQDDAPLEEPNSRERTIGEVLDLLTASRSPTRDRALIRRSGDRRNKANADGKARPGQ